MAQLVYLAIASLDGYVADRDGRFDWSMPDEEVHRFVNAQERTIGTHLIGRRLYDVLRSWDAQPTEGDDALAEYARLWQAADKVVFSRTLASLDAPRTRVATDFDPAAVAALKAGSARNLSVAGPELAGQALRAGVVDECAVLLSPVVVGGGTPWLPEGVRLDLTLLEQRRFGNGVVYLRYRVGRGPAE